MHEHEVVLADGSRFTVAPGETVLDAALRQGWALPYGCRGGFCGGCQQRIQEGEVAYPQGEPPALDPAERLQGAAILCQAEPRSRLRLEWAPQPAAGPPAPRSLSARVAQIETLAPEVRRIWLELPAGERLPFLAGQYIEVTGRDGRRRAFSLANPPHADQRLELHIRRVADGAFTDHVFERLQVGERWQIEGPHGQFYLREDRQRPVLLVAGGTGFAPCKSILEQAFAAGIERPIELYWGAATAAGLYLESWVRAQQRKQANLRYVPVVVEVAAVAPENSEATSETRQRPERAGRSGQVHEAVLVDHPRLEDFDIYIAGPPAMIEAARAAFTAHGADKQRLFYDAFYTSHTRHASDPSREP
ncbi:hypothetical protein CKO15_03810 [Halorhodospira abdelmalekii]|nr:hypothetical protein [Halorhodospira abdelmalekii]